jgi:hypothetical protein
MKVYRVVLRIIDFDDVGEDEVKLIIEHNKYPNHCITPDVVSLETRTVDWTEDHPLNMEDECDAEFERLFNKETE